MGVDIGLEGLPHRRGVFRRRVLRADAFERIIEIGRAFAERLGSVFAAYYRTTILADELRLEFLPLEWPAHFVRKSGRLLFSARTSNLGPGYHAALVEFVRSLEEPLEIRWQESDPDDEEGEYFDETDYFSSLDRSGLEETMTAQIQGLSKWVLEQEPKEPPNTLFLSMSLDVVPNSTAAAISPLGEWDRSFFESIVSAEGEDRKRLAARFFPWWHFPLQGDDLRKIGLALAWSAVRWISPEDEFEEAKLRGVLDCLRTAQLSETSEPVPNDVVAEIASLLDGEIVTAQAPAGIGHLRGTIGRPIMGGWSIRVPGTFRLLEDEDPTLHVLADRRITILSSVADMRDPSELVPFTFGCDSDRPLEELALDDARLEGRWTLKSNEKDQLFVTVIVRRPGRFCRQTYCLTDGSDVDRAVAMARTISLDDRG